MLERDVLHACLEFLHLRHIYAWRNNVGAVQRGDRFIRFGHKGSSDIIGVLPDGKFLAVECKNERGRLTMEQEEFLDDIRKNGGLAIVARSVNDLINALDNHGYAPSRRTY